MSANDSGEERVPGLDEPRQVTCAWCGVVTREGALPASHTVCPTCKAGVVAGLDTREDSATLARIEAGKRWWNAWCAGERARRDEVQERFDAFQRKEAVAAYGSAVAVTAIMLILSWMLMWW